MKILLPESKSRGERRPKIKASPWKSDAEIRAKRWQCPLLRRLSEGEHGRPWLLSHGGQHCALVERTVPRPQRPQLEGKHQRLLPVAFADGETEARRYSRHIRLQFVTSFKVRGGFMTCFDR